MAQMTTWMTTAEYDDTVARADEILEHVQDTARQLRRLVTRHDPALPTASGGSVMNAAMGMLSEDVGDLRDLITAIRTATLTD